MLTSFVLLAIGHTNTPKSLAVVGTNKSLLVTLFGRPPCLNSADFLSVNVEFAMRLDKLIVPFTEKFVINLAT